MKKLSWMCSAMMICLLALSAGCSAGAGTLGVGSARYSLPANSALQVRLNTSVTSASASVGQPVQGDVVSDVVADGHVVIPAGSQVTGSVTAVKPAKHFGGQAMVAVGFTSVTLPGGDTLPVEGRMAAYAKKDTAKDTGTIVGSTVGGAVLGRIIGKDTKGAVTGAVVGGGAGTAIASRKGDEAFLQAGASTTVKTRNAVDLPAV